MFFISRHTIPKTHIWAIIGSHRYPIEVPRVDYEKLAEDRVGEGSGDVRARVEAAREIQRTRFDEADLSCNADMGPGDVRMFCELNEECKVLMRQAMDQLQLSARGYHRVLKHSRTVADLASETDIKMAHLAESLQYRPRRWL